MNILFSLNISGKKTRARIERKKKIQKSITSAPEAEKENSVANSIDKKMAVKREKVLKRSSSSTSTTESKQQSMKVKVKTAAAKEQISKPDDDKVSAFRKTTRTSRKAMYISKNKPKSEKKVKEESDGVIGMRRSTRLASRESV